MNALPLNNLSWISINFSNSKLQSPFSQKHVLTETDLFKTTKFHQVFSCQQKSVFARSASCILERRTLMRYIWSTEQ